jgi:hypothetical protein
MAGPGIKSIVDAAAPYLFAINTAQSGGLAMFMLDNKKIMKPSLLFVSIYVVVRWSEALINRPNGRCILIARIPTIVIRMPRIVLEKFSSVLNRLLR